MKDIRLDKYIASAASCSRKDASRLIKEGRVCVDGKVCKKGDSKVPNSALVTLDGRAIAYREHVYYMMNKPAGVVCATEDKQDTTVIDILPPEYRRDGLFPAGRLDKDTTGLLIITDDGELAHRMLSPRKHVRKLYVATVDRPPAPDAEERFEKGLILPDGDRCLPAKLRRIDENTVEVELCEGRFHQVKKMLHEVGSAVEALERVRIGKLELDERLLPSEARELTDTELESLFA